MRHHDYGNVPGNAAGRRCAISRDVRETGRAARSEQRLHGARDHGFFVMSRHDYGEANFSQLRRIGFSPAAQISRNAHGQIGQQRYSQHRDRRGQPFRQKCALENQCFSRFQIRLHNCSKQIEKCPSVAKAPLFMRLSWHG